MSTNRLTYLIDEIDNFVKAEAEFRINFKYGPDDGRIDDREYNLRRVEEEAVVDELIQHFQKVLRGHG